MSVKQQPALPAAERLKGFIDRIENLMGEKKAITVDIGDVYQEARGSGFDVKAMRAVIKLRAMDSADRDEAETMLELYKDALGMDAHRSEPVREAAKLFRDGKTIDEVADLLDVARSEAGRLRQACVILGYIEGKSPGKNISGIRVEPERKPDDGDEGIAHDAETGEIIDSDDHPSGESGDTPSEPRADAEVVAEAPGVPRFDTANRPNVPAEAEQQAVVTPAGSAPLAEPDLTIPDFLRRSGAPAQEAAAD